MNPFGPLLAFLARVAETVCATLTEFIAWLLELGRGLHGEARVGGAGHGSRYSWGWVRPEGWAYA
jgi:hypothetical protein